MMKWGKFEISTYELVFVLAAIVIIVDILAKK